MLKGTVGNFPVADTILGMEKHCCDPPLPKKKAFLMFSVKQIRRLRIRTAQSKRLVKVTEL